MAGEWNMPRRAEVCTGCRRRFPVAEVFHVFLYHAETGYERRDYCAACCASAGPGVIATWQTRRPEPASGKTVAFNREAIYRLFERLEGAPEPESVRLRFVLGLLLWRKKILKWERTSAAGGAEQWEFSAAQTGAVHHVTRPDLDESQLEGLSQQLEQLLSDSPGELESADVNLGAERAHE